MTEKAQTNQDKILYQIKRLGPQTVKSLAEALGVTTMGIRQHISQLEEEGLIHATEPQAQKRGRPVKAWKLTSEGHGRFPDAHAQVTYEIITSVRDLLGEEALDQVIRQRMQGTLDEYRSEIDAQKSFPRKVEKLAELRTSEGYMAEVEVITDDQVRLIEQHCPICIAATSCQGFCTYELEMFQSLLPGATVTREDHLLAGARRCTYLISQTR